MLCMSVGEAITVALAVVILCLVIKYASSKS